MKIGDRFSYWTVIDFENYGVVCKCICGKIQWIAKNKLQKGLSTKCRTCSNKEKAKKNEIHGCAGKNRNSTYTIWALMKRRCYNKNDPMFYRYGGRGVSVCDRWHSFTNFLKDMGTRPSGKMIDRIDNDGDYKPENCKWSDNYESARNTSRNVWHAIDGRMICEKDYCKIMGINYKNLHYYKKKEGFDISSLKPGNKK